MTTRCPAHSCVLGCRRALCPVRLDVGAGAPWIVGDAASDRSYLRRPRHFGRRASQAVQLLSRMCAHVSVSYVRGEVWTCQGCGMRVGTRRGGALRLADVVDIVATSSTWVRGHILGCSRGCSPGSSATEAVSCRKRRHPGTTCASGVSFIRSSPSWSLGTRRLSRVLSQDSRTLDVTLTRSSTSVLSHPLECPWGKPNDPPARGYWEMCGARCPSGLAVALFITYRSVVRASVFRSVCLTFGRALASLFLCALLSLAARYIV